MTGLLKQSQMPAVSVASVVRCRVSCGVPRCNIECSGRQLMSCLEKRRKMIVAGRRHASLSFRSQAAAGVEVAALAQNPFPHEREMDGVQQAVSNVPGSFMYAVWVLLIGAGAAAGFLAGGQLPAGNLRLLGQAVGALAGAAGAVVASKKLKEKREEAAVIELYNLLVSRGNAATLARGDVAVIEAKYGVQFSQLPDQIRPIYGAFVEAVIPVGDEPLKGNEAGMLISFKDALGLEEGDAAGAHMDAGRRILRSRFEAGSRGGDVEQRKTFQKLIYLSTLVFGDQKAAFLLPWKRVFNLSDAQIYVAKRDNARQLFQHFLASRGPLEADRSRLRELRSYQLGCRLADDEAVEVVREAAEARVVAAFDRAQECMKRRARVKDYTDAMQAMHEMITFNRGMALMMKEQDLVPGLRQVSLAGGKFETAAVRTDLRDMYRIFLEESLAASGRVSDVLEADLADLRLVLGLGPKEGEAVREEVLNKVYRNLLRAEVQSGRLEAASSKAAVLQGLCERLHYDPQLAAALHRNLYRQKLERLLEKKVLTDADNDELQGMRVMLCIRKEDTAQLHLDLCGAIYRERLEEGLSTGIDAFDDDELREIRQVQTNVRLEDQQAFKILDTVTRKAFMGFVTRSRGKNRLEAAKELKKLVFFSNIVVAPLVEQLKPSEDPKKAKAMAELAELMKKAKEMADKEEAEEKSKATGEIVEASLASSEEQEGPVVEAEVLEKGAEEAETGEKSAEEESGEEKVASLLKAEKAAQARKDGESVAGVRMRSQKDITLAEDLDKRERLDTYKNFLLYCMSGEVVSMPMGTQVVVERDEGEFARLSQLGDILGLNQLDVASVHQGLAEQAFKSQVQGILGEGLLTKEKSDALEALREKMGLPKEMAERIVKGVQNQRVIGNLQAAKAQGTLTLEKLLDMKEQGIDIDGVVSEEGRASMYAAKLAAVLGEGKGEFDEERLLHTLPKELGLSEQRVARITQELAKDKKRNIFVQAVSYFRQRKPSEAVNALNNLLVCHALLPSGAESWNDRVELQDLFSLFVSKESDPTKQARLAQVLGLSDKDVANLKAVVQSGNFNMDVEMEEEAIF